MGPAVRCRRCRRSRRLRRRSFGWQAPQDVQQFGRLLMEINQTSHVVLEAKHHFITSAVQLINHTDQFVAFTGEALALTRKPLRLYIWRRAGFCRKVLSFSRHRSSLQRVVPVTSRGNRGGRAVRLPFGGESTSNGLNSLAQRASDDTARLCGGSARNARMPQLTFATNHYKLKELHVAQTPAFQLRDRR